MKLAAVVLAAALTIAHAAARQDPAQWPPSDAYTVAKDGIPQPRLLTKVTGSYTPGAMRQRVQGTVRLQFVIEKDGSVGAVRVLTSLDPVHGLDQAAIAALKQWRFAPTLVKGAAVRVMSIALMTFSIKELPPPMSMPEGFANPSEAEATDWVTETIDAGPVGITLARRSSWRKTVSSKAVASYLSADGFSVIVYPPQLLPTPMPVPMPLSLLERFSETMRSQLVVNSQLDPVAFGQSRHGQAHWLWLEAQSTSLSLPNVAPEMAAAVQSFFEGVHMWAFSTGAGSHVVQVICGSLARTGQSGVDAQLSRSRAAADCATMLKSISFEVREPRSQL